MRVATTGEPACARRRGHGSAAAAGIGKASTSHDTQANRNFVTWAAVIAACILLTSVQPNAGRRRVRSRHDDLAGAASAARSEEHTSELQSLMRISYAVFCLKTNKNTMSPHYPILETNAIE